MRIAYVDMIGGASGDMLLGALLDAGLPLDDLRRELAQLPAGGFEISASRVHRGGLHATLLGVQLDESGKKTRTWSDFEAAITASKLPQTDKATALRVFDLLAQGESAAHGVGKHDVHLHELGTVDTLVDVLGVIAGLRLLGIEGVHASPFPLSSGTSRSSHGVMAATAAATAEIYRITKVPVRAGGQHGPRGEAVTPTGAALLATIATFEPVSFTPDTKGYGAGNRNPEDYPNVVGLWVGEAADRPQEADTTPGEALAGGPKLETGLRLLETNIDDMTGEAFGYVQEQLLAAGALDVWVTPVQMKKSRPGAVLSVLARGAESERIAKLVLQHTTTLGVRVRPVERYIAQREMLSVQTPYGTVQVKLKRLDGEIAGIHPEFDDCKSVAAAKGVPLREVTESALAAARAQLGL